MISIFNWKFVLDTPFWPYLSLKMVSVLKLDLKWLILLN